MRLIYRNKNIWYKSSEPYHDEQSIDKENYENSSTSISMLSDAVLKIV